MPKLTETEFADFIDEPGVLLRVAVTREDGSPLVVPIFFIHRDGGIYFTPREKTEWFGCLRRDPRVALCIDEQPWPYRKILVEGEAELVHDVGEDDAWRDLYRAMCERYVSKEGAEAYVQNTIGEPRGLYRVTLAQASKVRSWRMPVGGEPLMGIWHDRYYHEGTKF